MLLPYNAKPITAWTRGEWNTGPWDDEPDIATWTMELRWHTLHCAVLRHRSLGHLCGYVGVGETHPAYRADSSYNGDFRPEVHGGITYSDTHNNMRWFGFDCAHSQDRLPHKGLAHMNSSEYRDFRYVMHEVRSLARQVAAYTPRTEE